MPNVVPNVVAGVQRLVSNKLARPRVFLPLSAHYKYQSRYIFTWYNRWGAARWTENRQ